MQQEHPICNGTKDRLLYKRIQRFLVAQLILGKLLEW